LDQNYPNPFNATTWITYTLPVRSKVQIDIYTVTGQRIARLLNRTQQAGIHKIEWQPVDLSSGVYIYHIQTEHYSSAKECVLLK